MRLTDCDLHILDNELDLIVIARLITAEARINNFRDEISHIFVVVDVSLIYGEGDDVFIAFLRANCAQGTRCNTTPWIPARWQ